MSISPNLIKALKKHKFKNGATITYTELNNEFDDKSPTDVANEIFNTFHSSNTNDKLEILNAIFDGEYLVVENTGSDSRKNQFRLVNEKTSEFSSLSVTQKKDAIHFQAKGTKIKIEFVMGTPKTIESPSDWNPSKSKKELLALVNKVRDKKDLAKLRDVIDKMLK